MKISDPGISKSSHQVTSPQKKFHAHHSYTDWTIACTLSAIDMGNSTGCKSEPQKNRFISKSSYDWKNDRYIIRKQIAEIFDSVPLFIVRYKLRPWLIYHAQKYYWKAGKILNSTFGVMNQIRPIKGSMLTFMVRCMYKMYLSQFLYRWPKVRSVLWPHHYRRKLKGASFRRTSFPTL